MFQPLDVLMRNYGVSCKFTAIMNADVLLGLNIMDVLHVVDDLQVRGVLSERVLLTGRRINAQSPPSPLTTREQYDQFVMGTYTSNPLYAPSRMVVLRAGCDCRITSSSAPSQSISPKSTLSATVSRSSTPSCSATCTASTMWRSSICPSVVPAFLLSC